MNVLTILEGELNINGLSIPVRVDISQAAIRPKRMRKRIIVIVM